MKTIKKLNKRQVAKNACKLIIESGHSIEFVALSLCISERTIYHWQTGRSSPNVQHIYGLSQLFEVSMESILA